MMRTAGPEPGPPPPSRPASGGWLSGVALGIAIAALIGVGMSWMRLQGELEALRLSLRTLSADVAGMRRTAILDIEDAPARGSDDAIVTLIEFSDYQCPFCMRHFQTTAPRIDAEYVQTGKVRYVFRDFPIDELHPEAIRAHEAAQCAREQGRYWELHEQLFTGPNSHPQDALEARAVAAGVNLDTFRECLASGRMTDRVRAIAAQATNLGANGTPAFFLGFRDPATNQVRLVRAISGAQPFELFQQAIDAMLAEVE